MAAISVNGWRITLSTGEVDLEPGKGIEVAAGAEPRSVTTGFPCTSCGAVHRAIVPIEFVYIDDDHYGQSELGYAARVDAPCVSCDARLAAQLRFTLTRHARGMALLEFAQPDVRAASGVRQKK